MERMALISQVVPPVEEEASLTEAAEARRPHRAAEQMRRCVRAARREAPEHFEKCGGATRHLVA